MLDVTDLFSWWLGSKIISFRLETGSSSRARLSRQITHISVWCTSWNKGGSVNVFFFFCFVFLKWQINAESAAVVLEMIWPDVSVPCWLSESRRVETKWEWLSLEGPHTLTSQYYLLFPLMAPSFCCTSLCRCVEMKSFCSKRDILQSALLLQRYITAEDVFTVEALSELSRFDSVKWQEMLLFWELIFKFFIFSIAK